MQTPSVDPRVQETARKLVSEVLKTRREETVVITCDTASDWGFVTAVEQAVASAGARPLVVRNEAPPHVGRAAEPYLPLESLTAAVANSDVWIELNAKWLLYSSVYETAMKRKRTRYMCLVGMNVDMAVRCVGSVDVPGVLEFQRALQKVTKKARSMHYTTPAGTDVRFENDPKRPVLVEGDVSGPGEYMLLGQVDWAPAEETINGTIVYDGSVNPPDELGLLKNPVKMEVRNGKVARVHGSEEAKVYERWLASLHDEKMYELAHLSYGCNPGAKLTGNVLEDERIWGVLEWGLGSQSETFGARNTKAVSHSDGITLLPTLEGDGELIVKDSRFVHPELLEPGERLMPGTRRLLHFS
jgi:leucyl aminopeptidase (aminopeptidase T)